MSDFTTVQVSTAPETTTVQLIAPDDATVVSVGAETTTVIASGTIGPQGPPGIAGPTGPKGDPGDEHVFIQNTAPVTSLPVYLWIQTGLGGGTDFTFWIEDNLP